MRSVRVDEESRGSFIHRGLKVDPNSICVEGWCPQGGTPCQLSNGQSLVPDIYALGRG